ncbi:hypothetical protein CPB85DRAFT_1290167 [Mucidula mucida]|nr:hypothetical protein CPB85DRAFT_1290167 [Mucidula mucida]
MSYGCTCGQCFAGWLSKRMVFQLDSQSYRVTYQYANPKEHKNVSPSAQLPPRALLRQADLDPGFYWGYLTVFHSIIDIIQLDVAPFFTAGGEVVYALDAITGLARDEWDGGNSINLKSNSTFKRLPECALDYDFALVREKVQLAEDRPWGPYSDDP